MRLGTTALNETIEFLTKQLLQHVWIKFKYTVYIYMYKHVHNVSVFSIYFW